jgi:hypothetical protein
MGGDECPPMMTGIEILSENTIYAAPACSFLHAVFFE